MDRDLQQSRVLRLVAGTKATGQELEGLSRRTSRVTLNRSNDFFGSIGLTFVFVPTGRQQFADG